MKTRWWRFGFEDLEYFRFSIYQFGQNLQTVYVYRIGTALIDTAQRRSRDHVAEALEHRQIDHILLTHHHEDHSGNAAFLKKRTGADVLAHEQCVAKLRRGPGISPIGLLISGNVDRLDADPIADGAKIDLGAARLRAIHTPGHSDDHLAFYDADRGWLYSGDMYVADRIKYFETGEAIDVQIESLEKLCALDFDVLLCSHNPKLKDGKARLERKLEIFKEFYGTVAELHRQGLSAGEIFRRTGRKEHPFYKYISFGHYSAVNLVKSVIRAEARKSSVVNRNP